MTFFIKVADDFLYDRIMEKIVTKSLTHVKEHQGGTVELEIIGSPDDYREFSAMINQRNETQGRTVAQITEGI